ncbi:MAG: HAMP domain-containing histidine kinase [Gammaproteobacteria bacterium]|nr:HAMP domain-containing histidine kinase [Gammaproteobacteria bacterium]
MSIKGNHWPGVNTPNDSSDDYAGVDRRNTNEYSNSNGANTWRPLQLLNFYRLLISGGFCVLLLTEGRHSLFNEVNSAPLVLISVSYLIFSLLYFWTIAQRKPNFYRQVTLHIVTDIIAITMLANYSGGFGNDIAILLAVAVAGGSVLSSGRNALFFAALASVAVLADTFFSHTVSYTHAGILGVTFFATAGLATYIARRIRSSENLAEQRGSDLLTMEQLTRYVIQRMQMGVLVVDSNNQSRLLNQSTREFLAIEDNDHSDCLNRYPALKHELLRWQEDQQYQPQNIKIRQGAIELIPRFAQLGRKKEKSSTLIFLEDNTALALQAQQLKLASLGHLTASIAHEIRNPLGAISHAGQLLAESAKINKNDKRLTEIISQQSKRLDKIVDNVMQLSQRKAIHTEAIELNDWLYRIKKEFCQNMNFAEECITIISHTSPQIAYFDPSHLHQIIWNLCTNALRHGQTKTKTSVPTNKHKTTDITMRLDTDGKNYLPILEISDQGAGINKQTLDKIFEPFFTTSHSGTGLGLYIARELCNNNQAHINYIEKKDTGACFRINFADTRRHHQAA